MCRSLFEGEEKSRQGMEILREMVMLFYMFVQSGFDVLVSSSHSLY